MKNKLYVAYGSNLNLRQMALRCPDAKPIASAVLKGWQLTFRGVATMEREPKAETPVGVWEITPACECSLDRYEGFPRLYRKEYIEADIKGKKQMAMVYLMNDGLPSMPSKFYLDAIAQGYEDVGLDTVFLNEALEHTMKKMTTQIGGIKRKHDAGDKN